MGQTMLYTIFFTTPFLLLPSLFDPDAPLCLRSWKDSLSACAIRRGQTISRVSGIVARTKQEHAVSWSQQHLSRVDQSLGYDAPPSAVMVNTPQFEMGIRDT